VTRPLTILGGGITGLAAGFYARRHGVPATIFESRSRPGGLSVTFEHHGFLFDSGAHRFHDKDTSITRDVRALLGDDLRVVDRPSRIFDGGRLLNFPFQLTDVLGHLGPAAVARGVLELATGRMGAGQPDRSFGSMARRRYGRTLAERFLLGYSRKLWGLPGDRLSQRVSGERLRGLDLRQFLLHTVLGRKTDRRHADEVFYYPSRGIGMLADALARGCDRGSLRTGAEVRAVWHDGARISSVAVTGQAGRVPVDTLVSTLPIDRLLAVLEPSPPDGILRLARALTHRNLVMVALFLRRPSVSDAATVYFPDPRLPFTRVTEPRNRSEAMSPPGHTSLVAEIPCGPGDPLWSADDAHLVEITRRPLETIGWIRGGDVLASRVVRIPDAYPVLSLDFEDALGPILRYLSGFSNLVLAGRNGRFEYGWIHDMMREGKSVAVSCTGRLVQAARGGAEAAS
jgi:protoporphyrinogen oxidase